MEIVRAPASFWIRIAILFFFVMDFELSLANGLVSTLAGYPLDPKTVSAKIQREFLDAEVKFDGCVTNWATTLGQPCGKSLKVPGAAELRLKHENVQMPQYTENEWKILAQHVCGPQMDCGFGDKCVCSGGPCNHKQNLPHSCATEVTAINAVLAKFSQPQSDAGSPTSENRLVVVLGFFLCVSLVVLQANFQ